MSTWWPDLDDTDASPEQRALNRDETLRKLKQKLESLPEFTPQELETLRWVIDTVRGWKFVTKSARAALVLTSLIVAGVLSWDKFTGWIRAWAQQQP